MQETTPEIETIDPKRRYLCRHVFIDGHRCGSPSLRGESLCYNHGRIRRENGISGRSGTFPMPRIDDRASVQLALYEVLSRLAGGDIEYKRGAILLRGLAIASSNLLRNEKANGQPLPQVENVTADYHLGDLAPITEIPDAEPAASTSESPAPQPQLREFTAEEKLYLDHTVSCMGHEPRKQIRPASVTNEDIEANINKYRGFYGFNPINTDPRWNKLTLSVHPGRAPVLDTIIPATSTDLAIPTLTPTNQEPTEVVILSEEKNPRIQPAAPQTSEGEATSAPVESNHRHSLTLAAVQAVANLQPPTCNLQPATPHPAAIHYLHP